jgi:hypothetical protein
MLCSDRTTRRSRTAKNPLVATLIRKNSKSGPALLRSNRKTAKQVWGNLSELLFKSLTELTHAHGLSVAAGHLQLLDGRWYITHAGLLQVAHRNRCAGIRAALQVRFSDPVVNRWVFKATVYRKSDSKGFVGYGDADPSNISPLVRGAEMRVAETRAVNRALRKAYGIGLCSVEELGWASAPAKPAAPAGNPNGSRHSNGSNGNPSRLRDKLCLLIRQYNLDPILVKAYAAHFCGTETIKDASRGLVESFISHLSSSAREDIDGLICKLNSYSRPAEVKQ